MSDSNQGTNYEANKCQQETIPTSFAFDKHGRDNAEEQEHLLSINDQNGTQEAKEESVIVDSAKDNQIVEPKVVTTDKALRKKDSTGVRWVDWEGIAEISEKKGIY